MKWWSITCLMINYDAFRSCDICVHVYVAPTLYCNNSPESKYLPKLFHSVSSSFSVQPFRQLAAALEKYIWYYQYLFNTLVVEVVWRNGSVVARLIRNRIAPVSNPAEDTWITTKFLLAGNLHIVALGQHSLAIPLRVGINDGRLCAAAKLTRSLDSLALSQETRGVGWDQAEGYRNGRATPTQQPTGFAEPKGRCCYVHHSFLCKKILLQGTVDNSRCRERRLHKS